MASGSTVEKYLKGWTAFNILQLLGKIYVSKEELRTTEHWTYEELASSKQNEIKQLNNDSSTTVRETLSKSETFTGPIFLGYGKPSTLAEQILPGAAAIHMRSHAHAAALMLIVKWVYYCWLAEYGRLQYLGNTTLNGEMIRYLRYSTDCFNPVSDTDKLSLVDSDMAK